MNSEFRQILSNLGKGGVNALYPQDFEYYLITLELLDSSSKTVDYLSFPISPDSITYDNVPLTNIKKTLGGVTTLDVESFVPVIISMKGTFGRQLKILLSNLNLDQLDAEETSSAYGNFGKTFNRGLQIKRATFNPKLKTGYGCIRLLNSLVDKSSSLDLQNQPHKLLLYNPALGSNYQVKVKSLSFSMDMSSNMLWNYSLVLSCVCPITYVKLADREDSLEILGTGVLQKHANLLANAIRNKR